MNLLLVLGAGASRNLGKDGQPMPLMSDWSNALCEELDRRDDGLAAACHLEPGMDGPTFETNLGLLLEWQSARWLEKRFQGLGGEKPGQNWPQVGKARKLIDRRMEIIMDVIHTTLYDQFGQKRIDDDQAEGAYQALLSECNGTVDHLLVATTNYDRAAESALRNIGWSVTTGFEQRPYRSPSLRPAGMVKRYETETPVIHLHGAVGWYENEGTVIEHSAELDYNHTLGTPVVLYPDPNKEPTTEEVLVYQLWQEFDRAIDIADMVLVIGHSLHDPPLVDALGRAIKARKPVVVSYLNQGDEEQIDMKLPDALVVQMNFGPQLESSTSIQELIRKHAS